MSKKLPKAQKDITHIPEFNALDGALHNVWQQIEPDFEPVRGQDNNIAALQMIIDVRWLTMYGYNDAQAEVDALIDQFGYEDVFAAICQRITLI